jgi:hypothetical protein
LLSPSSRVGVAKKKKMTTVAIIFFYDECYREEGNGSCHPFLL